MSFTPRSVQERNDTVRSYTLNQWQKRAMLGMLGMILLTFAGSNLWAMLWQTSDWLAATILPAVVVDMTNDERLATNAQPLERNPILDEAARQKAEHMALEGYFAHYSPDGVSPWHWFREVEYEFAHAGENLAVHFTDSRAVVAAWMNSPTHRENIENNQFTQIGVGTARGRYNGHDTIFVVQMFGTPAVSRTDEESVSLPEVAAETSQESSIDDDADSLTSEEVTETALTTGENDDELGESGVSDTSESNDTESQVVGGAEADSVEVVTEERSVALEDQDVIVESDNETAVNLVDDTADDTVAASATTSTTSVPYLARSEAEQDTEQAVQHWMTTTHATSSGLPVATTAGSTVTGTDPLNPFVAMSTKPGALLQFVYTILGLITAGMILWAMQLEIRRHRYVQVAYSLGLLGLMGGFWYVHETVTTGAIII